MTPRYEFLLDGAFNQVLEESGLGGPQVIGKRLTMECTWGGDTYFTVGIVTGLDYSSEEFRLYVSIPRVGNAPLRYLVFVDKQWRAYLEGIGAQKLFPCILDVAYM